MERRWFFRSRWGGRGEILENVEMHSSFKRKTANWKQLVYSQLWLIMVETDLESALNIAIMCSCLPVDCANVNL